ncbi:MAG: biopolymer transporter ExbD [Chlamydiae bacterium]|nr:biopolymer transporter ExbD [Chlamydiota bacterium]MBI3276531.1 biopolymer transporter ExbD [Chlamydiota bacterium]
MSFKLETAEGPSSYQKLGSSLCEINVIPLVDIVLVLLLIFMLTAPMIYQGIDVHLPKTSKSLKPLEMEERMILTLTKGQTIFLNEKSVLPKDLTQNLKNIFKTREDKTLYLKADRELSYGFVAEMMDQVHQAGISKIGMVTEPHLEKTSQGP